ncbi:MAG TPA: DUF6441 family protein [Xanthobacteraceae bacterium]|nr:DUF6441 family protein [Xanthobacteraceae bacterium]
MKSQFALAVTGNLKADNEKTKAAFLRGNKAAVLRVGETGKLRLREDVVRGGLGQRLANTWRYETYPRGAKLAYNPATLLFSSAPKIVDAHADNTVIVAKNKRLLAIPTENVPKRSGRADDGRYQTRRMSPEEVEARFNQDLILIKKGRVVLAFIAALRSRNKRGWRRAAKATQLQSRKRRLVLMFVLTPQVHLRKRLNYRSIFDQLIRDWPEIHIAAVNTNLGMSLR